MRSRTRTARRYAANREGSGCLVLQGRHRIDPEAWEVSWNTQVRNDQPLERLLTTAVSRMPDFRTGSASLTARVPRCGEAEDCLVGGTGFEPVTPAV